MILMVSLLLRKSLILLTLVVILGIMALFLGLLGLRRLGLVLAVLGLCVFLAGIAVMRLRYLLIKLGIPSFPSRKEIHLQVFPTHCPQFC
jgi:hypothetical protein